jgi:Cu-processing system permease protein
MTPVLAIAQVTYREAVRNRVLYSLLVFVAALLLISGILDRITLGQTGRVVLDLGLAAVHLSGALIAIYLGVSLMAREISGRTLHVVLAKPVRRGSFLLGKYLGLVATLGLLVGAMGLALLAAVLAFGGHVGAAFFQAVGMIWVELAVLTAVAVFFASFTGPFLSGMFTLGLFVAGHLAPGLRALGEASGDKALVMAGRVVYYLLPNLEVFDLKARALYQAPESAATVGLSLLYAGGLSALLLGAAALVFSRRDFR